MSKQNEEIKIPAHDGGAFSAYISYPEGTPAGAVIMIQEIFGVNHEMREKCDHMAAQGYVAICPDLFWRIEPGIQLADNVEEELQRAFQLFGEFDQVQGMEDLETTLGYMRNHNKCNGKVACIGYCLGGKLAYMMATDTDIDASVSYYGVGIEAMLDKTGSITKPLLIHIAGADEFVPAEAQEQIQNAMNNIESAEVYHYAGLDHAFARGNGIHYNAGAAELANGHTDEFISKALK